MNKIFVIALVLGIGWYGSLLYKKHGLAFVENLSTDLSNSESVKCITNDGRVIYGKVTHGTVCKKTEAVKGSLAVVSPSGNPGKTGGGLLSSFSGSKTENRSVSKFKCDGRIYCSDMGSCEEAVFFLNNCPGVKMDGDRDGVPCEKQWCR